MASAPGLVSCFFAFFYLQFSFAFFFFFCGVVKSAFCMCCVKKSVRLLEKLAVEENTTVVQFVKGRILFIVRISTI